MKILFIGDIVGKPGRRAVRELLPGIIEERRIDFVIANCENAAAGFGVTAEIIEELYGAHIDVLTSGNHIWDKKEVMEFVDDYETLLRPANYPEGAPGRGSVVIHAQGGIPVGVLNLAGRVFMHPLDCPFRTAERELEKLRKRARVIIVDMHAEATSEKIAMGWYLDGKVVKTYKGPTPQEKMFILMALFQYAGWIGEIDPNLTYPRDFEVDYVRVYARETK